MPPVFSKINSEVANVLSRIGVSHADKLSTLLVGAGGVGVVSTILAWGVRRFNTRVGDLREKAQRENRVMEDDRKGHSKKEKPSLDPLFFRRMKRLLSVCIPSWRSKQAFLLVALLGVLYLRTMASILVAKLDGFIVQAIVSKNFDQFLKGITYWLLLALPAVGINSAIRFLTGHISLLFRTSLVRYVHEKYMDNQTYYKIITLDGRIDNADQMITADVNKFCHALAMLYSDVSKPVMDLILYTWQLWRSIGPYGPSLLMGFYFLVGAILRFSSPPFGQLAAIEGSLEGIFRFCHSRLIQNSEEIAFYGGAKIEKDILNHSYSQLRDHVRSQLMFKVPYAIVEAFTLKYVASALVYSINGAPIFLGHEDDGDLKSRTGAYMESRRLLLDMAAAIQRVMEAYKEVTELSGYAARVCTMLEVFDDVQRGRYVKNISEENKKLLANFSSPVVEEVEDGDIVFDGVPIVTPNGDVLINKIQKMVIKPGMHLLITGPNGCGKSSLFRILGGLWPVLAGHLRRPVTGQMFYIPQRPYLSLGTFREQIIYPHTLEEFHARGGSDKQLEDVLAAVNLRYVLQREGGWDSRRNWKDRLSGGEKQRVGLARLFYHRPRFAILDECTSQVSIDWEGKMYVHAQEIGITLLTVSHRPSLWKYHQYVLQFDGNRGIELVPLTEGGHRMSLEQEREKLEHQLKEVPKLQERLQQLQEELSKSNDEARQSKKSVGDEDED